MFISLLNTSAMRSGQSAYGNGDCELIDTDFIKVIKYLRPDKFAYVGMVEEYISRGYSVSEIGKNLALYHIWDIQTYVRGSDDALESIDFIAEKYIPNYGKYFKAKEAALEKLKLIK